MHTLQSHKTPDSVVKFVSINCNNKAACRYCTGFSLLTEGSASMLFNASASMAGIDYLQVFGRYWILFLSKSRSEAKVVIPSLAIRVSAASELILMFRLDLSQLLNDWVGMGMIFYHNFVVFRRVKVYVMSIQDEAPKKKKTSGNLLKEDLRRKFELGCISFSQNDRSSLSPVVNTVGHLLTLLASYPWKLFNEVSNLVSVSNVFSEIWPFWSKFELSQQIDGFDYGVIAIPWTVYL